jgi:DNA uptake protein ComE-like DNA-binding protein/endonuclease YncB( thermonuclease family)
VAVLWSAVADLGARDGSKGWIVLENCRLISNPANDADSFHISVGNSEYIFRLYLVDAPETDALTPGRLVEQSKYFTITVPQVIEVGEAAKEFTRKKLSEPFTVFTRMSDAMGRSKLERFYAFVQTNEGDLGEQLVRNGLARVYGAKAIPPGFSAARPELKRLQELEDEARQDKIGGWGINAGRLNVRAPDTLAFSVFVPGEKAHSRATPLPNASLPISATRTPRPWIVTRNPVDAKTSHLKEKIELGKIDINAATEKELKTIPGIGPVMAARIIAARPFRSADDLKKVNGIGDKKYDQIRPYFQ